MGPRARDNRDDNSWSIGVGLTSVGGDEDAAAGGEGVGLGLAHHGAELAVPAVDAVGVEIAPIVENLWPTKRFWLPLECLIWTGVPSWAMMFWKGSQCT
jgi:hypothetical protein